MLGFSEVSSIAMASESGRLGEGIEYSGCCEAIEMTSIERKVKRRLVSE
jgi:hypothetical protein